MFLPRGQGSPFTSFPRTRYFRSLSIIMNPFQELQQRANMKQAAGGVPPHEEAQLWQDKLIGKTLIENDQATDLSDDQVRAYLC
jgi:hypothetical protein